MNTRRVELAGLAGVTIGALAATGTAVARPSVFEAAFAGFWVGVAVMCWLVEVFDL